MTMGKPHDPATAVDPLPAANIDKIQWAEIQRIQEMFHLNSVNKGFYDGVDMTNLEVIGNKLMLIVGEVSEAHEQVRAGIDPRETYYPTKAHHPSINQGPLKPEGVPSELADIIIRTFDLAAALGIDMVAALKEKHTFNTTRPYKHNKRF